jgi:hypothetical protein
MVFVFFQIHVLPREILGISTFGLSVFLLRWLPIRQVDSLLLFFTRLILGDTEKYGLPRPKIGPLQIKSSTGKTPVLDIGALRKIKTREIKVHIYIYMCDPTSKNLALAPFFLHITLTYITIFDHRSFQKILIFHKI